MYIESEKNVIVGVVDQLSSDQSYKSVTHRRNHEMPMPQAEVLEEVVELLRAVIFPGYYGVPELTPITMKYHIGAYLDRVYGLLSEQIKRGYCFTCPVDRKVDCGECETRARDITVNFISKVPEIRRLLASDVEAAFTGDPAAKNHGEVIFCYPSIRAMTNFRIAHELHLLGVEIIPRIITESAHSRNGIDIHPGATIGDGFFMDHGSGVVIGETCEIGRNVRLYQGVTLGAKSFPLDKDGNPIKGIPRHPIVEDDVIIYSGATILGRITIGKGAVVGGNIWITVDVPAGAKVSQTQAQYNWS
jgi:serine O-acetyltransferase